MYKEIITTMLLFLISHLSNGQGPAPDFESPVQWTYSQVNMSGYGWENNSGELETSGREIIWAQPSGMVYRWDIHAITENWGTTGEVTFHIAGAGGYLSFKRDTKGVITGKLYLEAKEGKDDIFEFKISRQPESK